MKNTWRSQKTMLFGYREHQVLDGLLWGFKKDPMEHPFRAG